MKARLILMTFAGLFLGSGCKTTKTEPIIIERVREITKTVKDTVIDVRIVHEKTEAVIASSDTSNLETLYARSAAWYDGANLYHWLENKKGSIQTPAQIPETIIRDSIPKPYPVYIDKPVNVPTRLPLRWYEKVFMYIGVALTGGGIIAALICFTMRR